MPRDFSDLLEDLPAQRLPFEALPPRRVEEKTLRWFELALVLLISFGSAIAGSLHVLFAGAAGTTPARDVRWIYSAISQIGCLLLLGYVLHRRKLRFADLGLRWTGRDIFSGLLVTLPATAFYWVAGYLLQLLHSMVHVATGGVTARQEFGHVSLLMAIPIVLLNPFFEELIVRAYLMTEVKELTGSWTLAIAASVAVQTSYHLYYGWVGALSLGAQFLVFSIYYARTRRIAPVIVAHGIFDAWGLLRLM